MTEGIIFLECCNSLFFCKRLDFHKFFSVIVFYGLLFGIYFFNIPELNTLAFFFTNIFLLFYLYRISWGAAFFYSGIFTAIMLSTELIIISAIPEQLSNFYFMKAPFQALVIAGGLSKILYFLGMYLLARISVRHFSVYKLEEPFNISFWLLITVPTISIVIVSIILAISAELNYPAKFDWLILLSAVLLLSLNLIIWIVYNYNQKKSLEFTELQLSLQKETDTVEYYKMLIQQNENQNVLIHDIKKHLQSIALLSEKAKRKK